MVVYGSTKCTHCKQDPIYVFQEMKLRGLVPNSYIHVSVSDLCIFPRSVHPFCCSKSLDRSGAIIWASEGVLRVQQGVGDIQKQFTHRGDGGPDKYKFTGLHYTALPAEVNPYGKGCIIASIEYKKLIYFKILSIIYSLDHNFRRIWTWRWCDGSHSLAKSALTERYLKSTMPASIICPVKGTVSREKRREFLVTLLNWESV